ncbi:MAG: histidine kinase [Firmicutes bacterium]|nr:histidine kinase [Bacillota bacterium]
MRLTQILAHSGARLRKPGTWGAVGLFGLFWNGLRILSGPQSLNLGEAAYPFAFGALALGLSAAPWQWTADDRPAAPLGRGLLQALLWTVLGVALLSLLLTSTGNGYRGGRSGGQTVGWLSIFPPRMMVILVATGTFQLLLGWILADLDRQTLRAEEQAHLAREAKAKALQAQMNPHVLYNTLGGLAELARDDGRAAEEAILRLAGLLRTLLTHISKAQVPLEDERTLVEGFLALQRIRLDDRLSVSWRWDERLEGEQVPPLLLQPLVENALKHGIAPEREGGHLEITLTGTADDLRLRVANTGKPLPPDTPHGTGLTNLLQRLDLMEHRKGTFSLGTEEGRTVAEVRLTRGGRNG